MAPAHGPVLEVRRDKEWVPLDPVGANPGFTELREAAFRVPDGFRLLVDDEPLKPLGGGEHVWKPGFYAGSVRAEALDEHGATAGVWRLDVSPDPGKLGDGLFRRMVAEILEHDPALVVGGESARRRLGALDAADDPLVALERLRRRERPLVAALAAIGREPRSVLRARRQWVPLHRVRRADLRTLRTAIREPAVLAALPRAGPRDHGRGSDRQPLLDTPAAERSLDSPANRAALFMLRALRRRAAGVLELLRERVREEHDGVGTRTSIGPKLPRWEEILKRMSQSFERAERRSPFRDVRRPELTAAGLNAVAAHPVYARFWRIGWEALRRGAYPLQAQDELPLSPTWEIYERWCFVELARRLRDLLPEDDWKESRTSEGGDRRSVRFRRSDGAKCTLFLQKTASRAKSGLRSVSRQCVPDLVLRWRVAGDAGFVTFDAKYRSGESTILSGMGESAHLYQDALRWDGDRADRTLLLVPDTREVPWLAEAGFIEENRVGAVTLRPGTGLPDWFWERLPGARASAPPA